jgi:hypothetical protein
VGDVATVRLVDSLGKARTIDDLTTLFDLCLVVVDGRRPAQLQRLAPVIDRLDRTLGDADCTLAILAVGIEINQAVAVAGPMAERVAVFADTDGSAAAALGLRGSPAFVWLDTEPVVRAVVEGWDGAAWRPVMADLAHKLAWTRPLMPAPGDPPPIPAQPFRTAMRPSADATVSGVNVP